MVNVSWNTAAVEPRFQAAMWRDITRRSFAPLEVVDEGDGTFRGEFRIVEQGRVRLTRVQADGHRVRQTRMTIGCGTGAGFSVKMVLGHSVQVQQFGEDVTLDPGDIALVDLEAPCQIAGPDGLDLAAIFLPGELVRRRLGPRGRPSSLRIRSGGLGTLIGSYIAGLQQLDIDGLGDMDYAMLDHLGALVGRAVRDTEGSPMIDRQWHITHQRILAEIEVELSNAHLSAEDVAQRLRISRSHLYAVLSEKGMTFAGILRERQLQAARAFLMTERFSETRITDIALRCGYADTASFARAYGRRFGKSPTASRAAF